MTDKVISTQADVATFLQIHEIYRRLIAAEEATSSLAESVLSILARHRLDAIATQAAEIARLREALEPFALIAVEGVIKPHEQDHVKIVTCGRFFHRARAALSAQPDDQKVCPSCHHQNCGGECLG